MHSYFNKNASNMKCHTGNCRNVNLCLFHWKLYNELFFFTSKNCKHTSKETIHKHKSTSIDKYNRKMLLLFEVSSHFGKEWWCLCRNWRWV